ncbi:acyltransferase family protein [Microbacterium mitrae]
MLNHLFPARLTGGYVGVDVFFVISGYLITAHLVREIAASGTVAFGAFYARRIRRLIPAALVVLASVSLGVWLFLPYSRWEDNAIQIAASGAYVENWVLAALSVNYSAHNDAASAVQHYWSLSVEEQFYIVWPILLIIGGCWLWRRSTISLVLRLGIVVALVTAASFVSSVIMTALHPQEAYFVTYTRAWEFGVGALVALAPSARFRGRAIVSIIGLGAIVAAAIAFTPLTPFPGYWALIPVLGTALVIYAGPGVEAQGVAAKAFAFRPVQWVGDVSYSLYLWHWPVLVILPFALSREADTAMKVSVLAVSLVLAWLTRRLVELPAQRLGFWTKSVRASFLSMIAGMLAISLLCVGLVLTARSEAPTTSPEAPLEVGICLGPDAVGEPGCDPFGTPVDTAVMSSVNEYFYTPDECGDFIGPLSYGETRTTHVCDFSNGAPTKRVWLVGDSHAQQWQGAIFDLARENQWELSISYYGGCPVADIDFVGFNSEWGDSDAEQCNRWSDEVADYIEEDAPDLVITSMAARDQLIDGATGADASEAFAEGLNSYWTRWTAAGTDVAVIADSPHNIAVRPGDCLLMNEETPIECARPRAVAASSDPLMMAVKASNNPNVFAIDLTDKFCDADACYAAVGGEPIYYDHDHLNLVIVRMLADDIGAIISSHSGAMR